MYQQQQSYPPLISPPQPPLVDRHYSSPASYNEPIQQTQYQQGYQYPTKTFSGANLLPSDTHSVHQHGEPTKQTSNQHISVNCLRFTNSYIQSSPSSTGHNYAQLTDTPHNQLYSREGSHSNVLPPRSHQHPPMKYFNHLGCQSELSQSQLHKVEYGVSPTNPYVNSGTCMLSSSLPLASTVAQSIGRNSQSSVQHESLVVAPLYPIVIVSAQSQPSTPQSRRQQYSNTGHSSSFPPHSPKLSYPNLTQQSSCQQPVHNPQLQSNFTEPTNTQTMSRWAAGTPFVQIPPVKQLDSLPQSRRQQYSNAGHSSSFPPHSPKLSYPNLTQQSSCQQPVHNTQLQSNFAEPMNTRTMSDWEAGTPFVQIPPVRQLDSLPQSRRQFSNAGHSSLFPLHSPQLSYPKLTQEFSTGVLPQYNLMSPPQVPEASYYPDLQTPPQPEQLPNFGDLKPHDEFIQPSRLNLPVHLSDHSSHSPEHMLTYSDNPTTPYDTEAIMQGNDENTYT